VTTSCGPRRARRAPAGRPPTTATDVGPSRRRRPSSTAGSQPNAAIRPAPRCCRRSRALPVSGVGRGPRGPASASGERHQAVGRPPLRAPLLASWAHGLQLPAGRRPRRAYVLRVVPRDQSPDVSSLGSRVGAPLTNAFGSAANVWDRASPHVTVAGLATRRVLMFAELGRIAECTRAQGDPATC